MEYFYSIKLQAFEHSSRVIRMVSDLDAEKEAKNMFRDTKGIKIQKFQIEEDGSMGVLLNTWVI